MVIKIKTLTFDGFADFLGFGSVTGNIELDATSKLACCAVSESTRLCL